MNGESGPRRRGKKKNRNPANDIQIDLDRHSDSGNAIFCGLTNEFFFPPFLSIHRKLLAL